MFDSNKNGKVGEVMDSGTTGTGGTAESSDDAGYFPEGQFPVCFSCHLAINQLLQLTNIEGKPIHVCCKAKIEAQMKSKDKMGFCDGSVSIRESWKYFVVWRSLFWLKVNLGLMCK